MELSKTIDRLGQPVKFGPWKRCPQCGKRTLGVVCYQCGPKYCRCCAKPLTNSTKFNHTCSSCAQRIYRERKAQ